MMETQTGMIVKIIPKGRFGFIRPDSGGPDIYFSYTGVISPALFGNLREGHRVAYMAHQDNKGRLYAFGIVTE